MQPKSHTRAEQGSNENTRDVFKTIRALDIGIANHEAWHSTINQTLVCRDSHANPADLEEDAHCRCKFGQWLYSPETEQLKNLETFHSVIQTHQKMHSLARSVLTKRENAQELTTDEYNAFTTQATAFKLEVRDLQYGLMSEVCIVDHLTGALNRYAMYSQLHKEKERQLRAGHSCAVCMMDIDHFKNINDTHSHTAGDQVLKEVIKYCQDSLRQCDSIYRFGGEEFLFCLPDAESDEVEVVIERLRAGLENYSIQLPNGEELCVTASFGIAGLTETSSVEDTIQAADYALLCAKERGRNRVCCWGDEMNSDR